MQLSVSTSPADPSLASFLPGGDMPCPAIAGGNAPSFGAQFPLLASTPAAIPADATVAPAVAELAPTWIGSTIPQASAQPRLPVLSGNAATPFSRLTAETPADALPAAATNPVVVVATPTLPTAAAIESTGPRPTSRGARRDEPASPVGVNSLSVEMAQALAIAPPSVLSAPVALPLAETAPAPSPVTVDATENGAPAAPPASPLKGSVVPVAPRASHPDAVLPALVGDTAEPIRAETGSRPDPLRPAFDSVPVAQDVLPADAGAAALATPRFAADEREAPSRPFATSSFGDTAIASNIPAPFPTAPTAVAGVRVVLGPDDSVSAAPTPADESFPSVRNFAPAEIHFRQFAFASPSSPAADLTLPYGASHSVAFGSSVGPASPAIAPQAVDGATVALPALPPTFPVAVSLAPSTSLAQSPVADPTPDMASAIASGAVESTVATPRAPTPHSRLEKDAPVRGAKIAATGEIVSSGKNREENVGDKTFVNVSSERVARSAAPVGTDVAKSEPSMSAPFNHPVSSAAVLEHAPVAWAATEPADRSAEFSATSVLAPETTEAAHRAVEAVLTAVERSSNGERHSVNLNFSVGGNDLNVRVELRADEVRATFLTDSPELRTALAHEWQAAHGAADSADRSLRLVTPVFASHAGSSASTSSNLTSFSGGDGSSRQRESGARHSAADFAGVRASGARSTPFGAAADSTSASAVARSAPPTSHRLHTHA